MKDLIKQELPNGRIQRMLKKAKDYYWEANNLQEDMPIGEFMIHIEDDSNSDDEGNMTRDS